MLYLTRLLSSEYGTRGVFIWNGDGRREIICHTYELPWLGNVASKSCIPEGEYDVIKATSPRFGDVFFVKDVPDRTGILIHAGNGPEDTRGCILPGLDVDYEGVVQSRVAMKRLRLVCPSSFKLLIRSV